MRITQLASLAALAASSHAFLIPPSIAKAESDIVSTLPFEAEAIADGRVMEISCPGCPVETTSQGIMFWGQAESVLRLNFSIAHSDGADRLLANGIEIYPQFYPHGFKNEIPTSPLTADQLIKSPDNTWVYSSSPELGFMLGTGRPLSKSDQNEMDLVSLHLEVIQVADRFVDGIPSIQIKLLETPSGKLMIGDASIEPAKSPVPTPADDRQECTTLLCKWQAIIADRISNFKQGCGKFRKAGRPRPHGIKGGPKPHGHGRPRPHGSHRPQHTTYNHHRRFGRLIKAIVIHVLIPVLIGVCVGITASLVGMIVGQIVVFTWRMLFRRGQQYQYSRVEPEDEAFEPANETKGFFDHQGSPPVYEEIMIVEEKKEQH